MWTTSGNRSGRTFYLVNHIQDRVWGFRDSGTLSP